MRPFGFRDPLTGHPSGTVTYRMNHPSAAPTREASNLVSQIWQQMSRSATLDAVALSAQAARSVVHSTCTDAQVPAPVTETALLLVSEVVTNAITHGDGRPVLDIEVNSDRMRVCVTDAAADVPRVQPQDDASEHGRGMFIVDSLASRWGVSPLAPTGKSIWFELDRA
jgi:anti-sigma regulatory factor (Ser/Thr protein kinase)